MSDHETFLHLLRRTGLAFEEFTRHCSTDESTLPAGTRVVKVTVRMEVLGTPGSIAEFYFTPAGVMLTMGIWR